MSEVWLLALCILFLIPPLYFVIPWTINKMVNYDNRISLKRALWRRCELITQFKEGDPEAQKSIIWFDGRWR